MCTSALLALLTLLTTTLATPHPLPQATSTILATPNPVGTLLPGFSGLSDATIALAVAGCANVDFPVEETANDILDGVCKDFTLLFARGTLETGNVGGIVGPPFQAALEALLGEERVAVQGVNDYAASIVGFLEGGSVSAAADLVALIGQTMVQCPGTKLCVSG